MRDLLRRHRVRPSRRWGQNFLIDRNALERVVAAAELAPEDGVLEIGPGLGTLTRALAERAGRVVAVEVDPRLVEALRTETLLDLPRVTLIQGDFLALDLAGLLARALGEGRHQVIANIPYSITAPVLSRLLEQTARLKRIVLMVQKEVGRRLAARPGTPDYGALSLLAQFYAEVETVGTVSPRCFFPAPEVDSAIMRLRIRDVPRFPGLEPERFFGVVRAAFQQRRKRLLNSLTGSTGLGWSRERAAAALDAAGIDPGRRGEGLSAEEFAALAQADPQR